MMHWIEDVIAGWYRSMHWTPPDDLVQARREIDDIMIRIGAEISVRRNYSVDRYGKRTRDRMADSKSDRDDNSNPKPSG